MAQLFLKIVWQFLKQLNRHVPYNLVIPLLNIYPKEMKTYVHTKALIQVLIAALLIISQT